MNPAENIEWLIKKFCQTKTTSARTTETLDRKILDDAVAELRFSDDRQINFWRIIMKSQITKFAAAAVIILAAALSIVILNKSATPAWAIEQTVESLENIQSIVISGTDRYGDESMLFKLWFRFKDKDSNSFELRYASDRQIVVVKNTSAWAYWPKDNKVKVYENVTTSENMMRDLYGVYQLAELNPWITAMVFEMLKSFTDDWQETYGKDDKTGRKCVFVTCSYKPLCISFWFVCDVENKLIIEGKYWRNVSREGQPECHAINFAYNEAIPNEIFNFQIPEGATVINGNEQNEARALFNSGEKLFQQKEYTRAIEVFQRVYEQYPRWNIGEEALMMIGICYDWKGEYEKEIEYLTKAVNEYPNLKGWIEATYFYLGIAYMQVGQKEKALESFENCLIMGEGIRRSDRFPLKNAREYIKKLENPEGAAITNKEDQNKARTLFNSGEKLFQQKEFAQAIKIYQQVYEQYPQWNIGEEALSMIGICYSNLGQTDKAIEAYEKCVKEYPDLKGWTETTYFYLGCAYFDSGRKEKALESFRDCLVLGDGIHDPDKFPLKDAREYIEKLEKQK